MKNKVEVKIIPEEQLARSDFNNAISECVYEEKMMTSNADNLDYLVSISSGLLCGILDILWVGDFSLSEGREYSGEQVEKFVKKIAKIKGCEKDDIKSSVAFLEKEAPIPSDGNTPEFGGGLNHHLRDFAHHPTIVGLMFSLLTQFTGKSYGTDVDGNFIFVDIKDKSKEYIGVNIPDRIIKGTVDWFFHLVSDMAGSSSTAGLSGGTGIPGPILSLAKEVSSLPLFKNMHINNVTISKFISKLFNGTIFAKRDENGKIIRDTVIKFDLRGELGLLAEIGKQALPVIANECIVRAFYFIRRLINQLCILKPKSLSELKDIDWDKVKPYKNATITRMLTVSTGVFTALDVADAIVSKKYFVAVNYVGVGRFIVALGQETINFAKVQDIRKIRNMYDEIRENTFNQDDNNRYKNLEGNMDIDKFGLSMKDTEILYNIEYQKTLNDIEKTNVLFLKDSVIALKKMWLEEWMKFMETGFPEFIGVKEAKLTWYSKDELLQKIKDNEPNKTWFRLVLLEAMIFEPYYTISMEKDKKGKEIPSKKYDLVHMPFCDYDKSYGDDFLNTFFDEEYYEKDYIKRLRKCYDSSINELKEVLKSILTGVSITLGATLIAVLAAGMFAPAIAVAIFGSDFVGLSGAALTSACLAYAGGGAIAIGGAGMAGGTIAIVGGGALIGLGAGAGIGGAITAYDGFKKDFAILQSAKLMVSVKEIFLNDEHDVDYADKICKKYLKNISQIEKELVDLKLKSELTSDKTDEEVKQIKESIKNKEDTVKVMKIAIKDLDKFVSSFQLGLSAENK